MYTHLLIVLWWDFSGYSWISGFRFLSECNKNNIEMHFECDFVPFRIQYFNSVLPMIVLITILSGTSLRSMTLTGTTCLESLNKNTEKENSSDTLV